MSRRFRDPHDAARPHREGLPTDRPIALYYRQSSEGSIGNVYTSIQTVDMFAKLVSMGWPDDRIRLIDIDEGVSGALSIDERAGMAELYDLIIRREVGAVAAHAEDRFFRDATMIQPNVFIDACKRAGVKVITSSFVYDFAHPRDGAFHVRQFRWKCEMGAEYINTQVIEKLAGARAYLMRLGRWAGAPMPVGYMADMRKEVRPKEANPNRRLFVPFEAYASVVREYFRLFIAYGGDLARTHYHIYQHGVFFPDPVTTPPPEGFVVRYNLRPRNGVYYPTRVGLKLLLTNPVYIGHWHFKNTIVQWNNHPPIVREDDFWQVFNQLSEFSLDGSPNPNYRRVRHNSRPTAQEDRDEDRPLCAGLLYGAVDGNLIPMFQEWDARAGKYKYKLSYYNPQTTDTQSLWARHCDTIDEAVSYHLRDYLRSQFSDEGWTLMMRELEDKDSAAEERTRLQHQLQAVESDMERTKLRLRTYDDADLIRDDEKLFQNQKAERARILAKLETLETQRVDHARLLYMRDHFTHMLERWDTVMTRDEKHKLLQWAIERIVLVEYAYRKPSLLHIVWNHPRGSQTCFVVLSGSRGSWTYAELQALWRHLEDGTPPADIRRAFSHHPKASVYRMLKVLSSVSFDTSSGISIRNHIQVADLYSLMMSFAA